MPRWGIAGLGKIAHKFLNDLLLVDGHQIVAVGSRSQEKAENFAHQYSISRAHGSYAELFADDSVDIIYISTPHHAHAEVAIRAMEAGKHVLCEKPLAVNEQQVRSMVEVARTQKVFLMEALWSRFMPAIREALRLVREEELGPVNYLSSNFAFYSNAPVEGRLFNPRLAGGALLDIGIYPVFLAYLFMGMPQSLSAKARFHPTGVDLQTSVVFEYEEGMAQLFAGLDSHSDMRSTIGGPQGSIFLDPRWHETEGFQWTDHRTGETRSYSFPKTGKGYSHEIEECGACIAAGKQQSDLWSWQNSLELIRLLDAIREQIGLVYPFEKDL
jgi:predicted dehydrogenase